MPDNEMPMVDLHTDGACVGNPGPGGYAAILIHPQKRREISGGFRLTTNNRMELLAVIRGLEELKMPCNVTVHSDSKYVVDGMVQGWPLHWRKQGWRLSGKKGKPGEPAKNVDLWRGLLALCQQHAVTFQWVKGHNGQAENERCNDLAEWQARQPNLPKDEGYETGSSVRDGYQRLLERVGSLT